MSYDIWGFHYKGKDKRGVSQWRGSGNWERLLNGLGLGFMTYGVCAAIVFLGLLLFSLLTLSLSGGIGTLIFVSGVHILAFGGSGLWMRNLRKHIRTLDTADQLSARFGVNEATLNAFAQDKDIKPRMNINGVDYYNPADFAEDALTLLRGTTRPTDTGEILLRPVTADDASTAPEQLLRVPSAELESAQTVTTAGSATSLIQTERLVEQTLPEIQRQ